jgi:hypothetical protein
MVNPDRVHFGSLEAIERQQGHHAQLVEKIESKSNGKDLSQVEDITKTIPVHDQEQALKEIEQKVYFD